jgi:DNA-binding response OmpR family regulator
VKPLRILVVEDHVEVGEMLAEFLADAGHTATHVRTVAEATAALAQGWDIVISDLRLPDGSGLDVGRIARAHSSRSTLIALTGLASSSDEAASRGAGFDYHLVKPVSLARLRAVIDTAERGL